MMDPCRPLSAIRSRSYAPAYSKEHQGTPHVQTPESDHTTSVLVVLGCDAAARPGAAPELQDLTAAIRAVRREGQTLIVDFDPAAADTVAAVVAAERRCCAEIGWHLETQPAVTLRIVGSAAQLDELTTILRSTSS